MARIEKEVFPEYYITLTEAEFRVLLVALKEALEKADNKMRASWLREFLLDLEAV